MKVGAESRDYFEVTYVGHTNPSKLYNWTKFQTMEFLMLVIYLKMPFWEGSRKILESRFPMTYQLICEMKRATISKWSRRHT